MIYKHFLLVSFDFTMNIMRARSSVKSREYDKTFYNFRIIKGAEMDKAKYRECPTANTVHDNCIPRYFCTNEFSDSASGVKVKFVTTRHGI